MPASTLTTPSTGAGCADHATAARQPSISQEAGTSDRHSARIVLVKPGDYLAIGNVGQASEHLAEAAIQLKEALGLAGVFVFDDDVDLAVVAPSACPSCSVPEVVHACPPVRSGLTGCCRVTPFGLPRTDRMTSDPAQVTCTGPRGGDR